MKKKIAFYNIPALMPNHCKLTFDGDKKDLRLHSEEMFRWGAKGKREYTKGQKEIDNISYKGKGWELYAWYDASSFEYWMKQMEETNYIQISISFDKTFIDTEEINKIADAVDNAISEADAIQFKYSYDPCTY